MTTMTRDQIYDAVSDVLEDALGVDREEITPEATLTGDLGAESIDFLDIVFRLEKNFDIKIPRGDLFPDEKLFSDARFVKDGKMTAEGLTELRSRLPFADIDEFAKNPSVKELSSLYTVETIVKYIEGKIRKAA